MAKYRIFTLGFSLPGEEFEDIEFSSNQTLLDADIVLFEPGLHEARFGSTFNGLPKLTEESSFQIVRHFKHWQSEIFNAIAAGKLIIVFVTTPLDAYRYNGDKAFSGTGKNARVTNIVVPLSSYEFLPNLNKIVAKTGTSMRISKDASYLRSYWSELATHSSYQAHIEGDFTQTLLTSTAGDKIVGAAVRSGPGGALLFLPPIRYDTSLFLKHDKATDEHLWTPAALQFGKRLVSILVSMADSLKAGTNTTPTPSWALDAKYYLEAEVALRNELGAAKAEADRLAQRIEMLNLQIANAGGLRSLLYEQGKPLESAVVESLRLMGFQVEPYAQADSEFDAVFFSPEGRCLGEAEGKDRQAINIDKMSQLERNVNEDFERDEVTAHAKPVLFGNAYRFSPLQNRGDYFTQKCMSAAKRNGTALVRTPDMFELSKYLKAHPNDQAFALACRKAIFHATGSIVEFPVPPVI